MNDMFLEVLSEIYEVKRDLFETDVKSPADVNEKYNVFRSF